MLAISWYVPVGSVTALKRIRPMRAKKLFRRLRNNDTAASPGENRKSRRSMLVLVSGSKLRDNAP